MSTRVLHPDLRRVAFKVPPPVRPRTLPLMRMMGALHARVPSRGVHTLRLAGGPAVRLHRPSDADSCQRGGALLWIHGGGYIFGNARQDDALCRRFAKALGITVAAVEYRLAPEDPYPAALNDCEMALTWLASLPEVDPARVAVGGNSAGGGLATALALRARDSGSVKPVFQLLGYPMLDDRTSARDTDDSTRYFAWDHRSNRFGWASYLSDADPSAAVPARRVDLAGLPPAWIGVGTLDLFHHEAVTYAERLTAAGVASHLEVVPGVFHGFDQVAPKAPVSRAFFANQCENLQRAFMPDRP